MKTKSKELRLGKIKWLRNRRALGTLYLTLVLITFFLLPTTTLAANPQTFEASGPVYISISDSYKSWQTGPVQHAVGEPVDGFVDCSDWDAISSGSSLETLHAGVIVLQPDGTFKGSLNGTFTLKTANVAGGIEGNMRGEITGTWNPDDPNNPTGTYIDDYGTFTSTKGFGTLAGVKINGTWRVHLGWDAEAHTYNGEATLNGTYR